MKRVFFPKSSTHLVAYEDKEGKKRIDRVSYYVLGERYIEIKLTYWVADQGAICGVSTAVDIQDALSNSLAASWDVSGAVLGGVARRRAEVSGEASHGDVHLIGHASGCWVTIVGGVGLESNEAGLEGSGDSDGRESKSKLKRGKKL